MNLGSIFQSGAVLQRDKYIPIWGKGKAESLVKAEFAGFEAYCRSSREGNFLLYLPPVKAGGPFVLKVSIPDSGEEVICDDVLVGDVWLCSGQSNMEYKMSSDWRKDNSELDPLGRRQEREFCAELKKAANPGFRCLTIPQCASGSVEESVEANWVNIDEKTAGEVSAVGGWFGWELMKELNVPVGLIVSAWGGTRIEAWVGMGELKRDPALAYMVENRLITHADYDSYGVSRTSGYNYQLMVDYIDPGISEEAKKWSAPDFDDSSWESMEIPGSWVLSGIAGNGAVWVRKKVQLPESWLNQPLVFHTGGIDKHDISFCNGVEIGRTGKELEIEYYNTSRHYSIPAAVNNRSEIVIAVRGYSFASDGSFMGTWQLENCSTGEKLCINGNWAVKAELDFGKIDVIKCAKYGAGNQHTPGILFDGMIKPLGMYAIKGALWYQGESNAQSLDRANEYRNFLHCMADCWRRQFDDPEMPLLIVQLAGYGIKFFDKGFWSYLRESQRIAAIEDKNIHMISAIDVGEELDIHPQDKKIVGARLAACALNKVYGLSEFIPCGPEILKCSACTDGKIKLDFDAHGKIKLLENAHESIYIANEDGEFSMAASAVVDGENSLIVTPGKAGKAVEVRYAWADYPKCKIFNDNGDPASSFRMIVEN